MVKALTSTGFVPFATALEGDAAAVVWSRRPNDGPGDADDAAAAEGDDAGDPSAEAEAPPLAEVSVMKLEELAPKERAAVESAYRHFMATGAPQYQAAQEARRADGKRARRAQRRRKETLYVRDLLCLVDGDALQHADSLEKVQDAFRDAMRWHLGRALSSRSCAALGLDEDLAQLVGSFMYAGALPDVLAHAERLQRLGSRYLGDLSDEDEEESDYSDDDEDGSEGAAEGEEDGAQGGAPLRFPAAGATSYSTDGIALGERKEGIADGETGALLGLQPAADGTSGDADEDEDEDDDDDKEPETPEEVQALAQKMETLQQEVMEALRDAAGAVDKAGGGGVDDDLRNDLLNLSSEDEVDLSGFYPETVAVLARLTFLRKRHADADALSEAAMAAGFKPQVANFLSRRESKHRSRGGVPRPERFRVRPTREVVFKVRDALRAVREADAQAQAEQKSKTKNARSA